MNCNKYTARGTLILRVIPFGEDKEKFVHKCGSHSIWVKLTGSGHQHGPRHTTKESKHVGVNPTTWKEIRRRGEKNNKNKNED